MDRILVTSRSASTECCEKLDHVRGQWLAWGTQPVDRWRNVFDGGACEDRGGDLLTAGDDRGRCWGNWWLGWCRWNLGRLGLLCGSGRWCGERMGGKERFAPAHCRVDRCFLLHLEQSLEIMLESLV